MHGRRDRALAERRAQFVVEVGQLLRFEMDHSGSGTSPLTPGTGR
jgi:hypothetical protein